jgi:phosphoribosyl 1,2-cyclic phosphate phosphodiesterase
VRLTFLGTAASEGYPNAFCGCDACNGARAAGGPNIRRRSSALIEDDLLIDIGPDLMGASAAFDLPLHTIRYVLQTHEHGDHLDLSHFSSRSANCGVPNVKDLTWLASASAATHAAGRLRMGSSLELFQDPQLIDRLSLRHRQISVYEPTEFGSYRVFSVPANHGAGIDAMLHAIERNGRRLFYATDTGTLPVEVWEALARDGWVFDVVAMDHTFGMAKRSNGHMNSEQFREHIAEMKRFGLLHDGSRIFATHIAHHSNPLHDELTAFAAGHGYEIAHDGLVVNV